MNGGDNQLLQVHVKNIYDTSQSERVKSIVNRRTYEIVLRLNAGNNNLTNINVMLTKVGLADCIDKGIYDGEGTAMTTAKSTTNLVVFDTPQPSVKVTMPKNAQSRLFQTSLKKTEEAKLERDVRSVLSQSKTLNERPANSVMCRVTMAISPSEIWLQDSVDAERWYQWFQEELAKK